MAQARPIMEGKRGLIMGVANERSLAWGIAKAVSAQGAALAFTWRCCTSRTSAVVSSGRAALALVMASATPSVATYHRAATGGLALATLPRRVTGAQAEVELVDMRDELEAGHRHPLSRRLLRLVDGRGRCGHRRGRWWPAS